MRAVASIEQAVHDLFQDIDEEAFDRLADRLDENVELADEITGEWLRGKQRVAAYLQASKGVVTDIHSRLSSVSARWLTDSVGLATFSAQQHYSLDVLEHDERLTGTALFAIRERRPARLLLLHLGTWSLADHHEPPAPESPRLTGDTAARTILGERLRQARLDADLSLRALADRAGVSASLLSQLERGVTEPNLSSLRRIATALGTSVGRLVDPVETPRTDGVQVIRSDARRRVDIPDSPLRAELLVPDGGRELEAWIGTLPPADGSDARPRRHPRDEFILILEGRMKVTHAGGEMLLETGDAVYIHAEANHRLATTESSGVRFLSVIPLGATKDRPRE